VWSARSIVAAVPGLDFELERDEKADRAITSGDLMVFNVTRRRDPLKRPLHLGRACLEDPLNGKCEGRHAPSPDAIMALATKGVLRAGTHVPTLGGVKPKRALMTYWSLGGKGMAGVEYLTNVGQMPRQAYFLFAAVKIKGGHGGHGRAIALY
jgi:kynurenine formamidase